MNSAPTGDSLECIASTPSQVGCLPRPIVAPAELVLPRAQDFDLAANGHGGWMEYQALGSVIVDTHIFVRTCALQSDGNGASVTAHIDIMITQ